MTKDWQKYIAIAYNEARKSNNPSTQNAAVLIDDDGNVIASAFNSFPNGIKESVDRQNDRLLRHKYSVHAERNVIYAAAKLGIKTDGLTMVCPWATCTECAWAIIQAGIKKLVVHKQALDRSANWQETIDFAFAMLRESGVEIIVFDGKIGNDKILRKGEYWIP